MKNNKKGFTLVELVIVVAVMAVLVAVAIPTVSSIVSSAEDAVAESNARTIESMIKLYMADNEATESTTTIDAAITEAKLGITGKFSFDSLTGVVAPVDTIPTDMTGIAKTTFYIECNKDATAGTGNNAPTAEENSVLVTAGSK